MPAGCRIAASPAYRPTFHRLPGSTRQAIDRAGQNRNRAAKFIVGKGHRRVNFEIRCKNATNRQLAAADIFAMQKGRFISIPGVFLPIVTGVCFCTATALAGSRLVSQ
jgi:hypothetical protein